MVQADNRGIAMQMLFLEKAFKEIHFFLSSLFRGQCLGTLLFLCIEVPCVSECGTIRSGVEMQRDRLWRSRAIWMPEEEAVHELVLQTPKTFFESMVPFA